MSAPRNVTPGLEDKAPRPSSPDMSDWMGWSWASRGRSFPWLGVLLVAIGAGLLFQYFVPAISIATLVLIALAAVFLAGWLLGHSYFAAIPGLLIGAVAVARLIDELNIYDGPGTTSLALAVAFLIIWFIGNSSSRRRMWPLWGAAIFGLVGLVQVAGRLGSLPELNLFWPILIIVVGVIFMAISRRNGRPQPPARF